MSDVFDDEYWRERLTDEQFYVCRQKGTEPAFTGKYTDTTDQGVYQCVCCGSALFDSESKFHSGCGWPSFTAPAHTQAVEEHLDLSHGMRRTEITCQNCGAHLGHVFNDGPHPTGLRYCINSIALTLDTDT